MVQEEVVEQKARLLGELLKEADGDKQRLQESLSQLFEDFFGQVLGYIEVLFPFDRNQNGQKSQNELQFVSLRSKVLRAGNDKIRLSQELLADYLTIKVYESKKTTIYFGKDKENSHG